MRFTKVVVLGMFCVLVSFGLMAAAHNAAAQENGPEDKPEYFYKPASSFDRGYDIMDTGEFQGRWIRTYGRWGWSFPYWRAKASDLSASWGEIYSFYIMVGMPPGDWGKDIETADFGIEDRSMNYNVIEQASYEPNTTWNPNSMSDWEGKDGARQRSMGSALVSNSPQVATSVLENSWPEGYYGSAETYSGSGTWTDTPGERHWPGWWARDTETGKPIYGKFSSSEDTFFIMSDKYMGIRAGDQINKTYPVGIDMEIQAYQYTSPLYKDLLYFETNGVFQTEAAVRAEGDLTRRLYNGTIDGVYVGLYLRTRIPRQREAYWSSRRARPEETDMYIWVDEATQALFFYHRWGWATNGYGGGGSRSAPVPVYGIYVPETPEDLGVTSMHYFNDDVLLESEGYEAGQDFEKVLYGFMSGDPSIFPDPELDTDLYFHPYPEEGEIPDYNWDNWREMQRFVDFDLSGEPYDIDIHGYADDGGDDDKPETNVVIGTGPFSISPGDTIEYTFAMFGAWDNPASTDYDTGWPANDPVKFPETDPLDRFGDAYTVLTNAVDLFNNNFQGSGAPATPTLWANGVLNLEEEEDPIYIVQNGTVTLFWNEEADLSIDVGTKEQDFEGYRLWNRIWDPNGTTEWELLEQWDLINGIKGLDPIGVQFFLDQATGETEELPQTLWLGDDTGVVHSITISGLTNGLRYDYALTAYDRPDDFQELPSQESLRGESPKLKNAVRVMPVFKPLGYVEGDLMEDEDTGDIFIHTTGDATGPVERRVMDELMILDHTYTMTFGTNGSGQRVYNVFDNTANVFALEDIPIPDVSDIDDGDALADFFPYFNGLGLRLQNHDKLDFWEGGWSEATLTSREATGDETDWDVSSLTSQSGATNAVYELRYGPTDFAYNSDTGEFDENTVFPFQVWNVTYGVTPYKMVLRQTDSDLSDSWESGERIYLREPDDLSTSVWRFDIDFAMVGDILDIDELSDGTLDTTYYTAADIAEIQPKSGDVYWWTTTFPFSDDNVYTFETASPHIDEEEFDMYRIRVVPNPYVVSSQLEHYVGTSAFNIKEIRFVNLPEECTIDIYTLDMQRVKTINHRSSLAGEGFLTVDEERYSTGIGEARWDLITFENLEVSYGMYIYVVKTPDGRTKVGKFILIK